MVLKTTPYVTSTEKNTEEYKKRPQKLIASRPKAKTEVYKRTIFPFIKGVKPTMPCNFKNNTPKDPRAGTEVPW